jgi:hypothetical protein
MADGWNDQWTPIGNGLGNELESELHSEEHVINASEEALSDDQKPCRLILTPQEIKDIECSIQSGNSYSHIIQRFNANSSDDRPQLLQGRIKIIAERMRNRKSLSESNWYNAELKAKIIARFETEEKSDPDSEFIKMIGGDIHQYQFTAGDRKVFRPLDATKIPVLENPIVVFNKLGSGRAKIFQSFREAITKKGFAIADFENCVSDEGRKALFKEMGGSWTPGSGELPGEGSIWQAVVELINILEQDPRRPGTTSSVRHGTMTKHSEYSFKTYLQSTSIFQSHFNMEPEIRSGSSRKQPEPVTVGSNRYNPKHGELLKIASKDHGRGAAAESRRQKLINCIEVIHHMYPFVAEALNGQKESFFVANQLCDQNVLSYVHCGKDDTESHDPVRPVCHIQLEHRDDKDAGLGALFSLVENQYVVVYENSHSLYKTLDEMSRCYDSVVKDTPENMSKKQYWNLACILHLEAKYGKTGKKAVRPVKVNLPVGKVFFFHFGCVHCGMGRTKDDMHRFVDICIGQTCSAYDQ